MGLLLWSQINFGELLSLIGILIVTLPLLSIVELAPNTLNILIVAAIWPLINFVISRIYWH